MSEHIEPVAARHPGEVGEHVRDKGGRLVRIRLVQRTVNGNTAPSGHGRAPSLARCFLWSHSKSLKVSSYRKNPQPSMVFHNSGDRESRPKDGISTSFDLTPGPPEP